MSVLLTLVAVYNSYDKKGEGGKEKRKKSAR